MITSELDFEQIARKFSFPVVLENKRLREINPAIDAHFAACKAELERFPTVRGVIRDEALVDWVSCPACGSGDATQWLVKWGGRYDICSACGHYFLRNPLKQEILLDLYSHSIADELDREANEHSFNLDYWRLVYEKYLDLLDTLTDSNQKQRYLLDIGCGSGHFLTNCIKSSKFDCYGVDVYRGMIEKLGKRIDADHLYQVKDILNFKPNQTFDVVTLWGVLEHLRDANHLFAKMNTWMPLGGIVLALIPNINSRALRILGATVPTLNPREHINFYTPNSIESVARKHNYEVLGTFGELPIIDLMWPFLDEDDTHLVEDIVLNNESYYQVLIFRKTHDLLGAS